MIVFQPSGKRIEFEHCFFTYALSKKDGLHVYASAGWCYRCRNFKYCEYIQSLEELDREIESYYDPASKNYAYAIGESSNWAGNTDSLKPIYFEQIVDCVRKRRNWRATRVSPPKCLWCGSTNIILFPFNEQSKSPCSDETLTLFFQEAKMSYYPQFWLTSEGGRMKARELRDCISRYIYEVWESMLEKVMTRWHSRRGEV